MTSLPRIFRHEWPSLDHVEDGAKVILSSVGLGDPFIERVTPADPHSSPAVYLRGEKPRRLNAGEWLTELHG